MFYEIHGFMMVGGAGLQRCALLCNEKELNEAIEDLKRIHQMNFGVLKNFRTEYVPSIPKNANGLSKPYVRLVYEGLEEEARSVSILRSILEKTTLGVKGPFATKYNANKHMYRKKAKK